MGDENKNTQSTDTRPSIEAMPVDNNFQQQDSLAGLTTPTRRITGVTPEFQQRMREEFAKSKGARTDVVPSRQAMALGIATRPGTYSGPNLVNAQGQIARGRYDIYEQGNDQDVITQMNAIATPAERLRILTELKRVGFYGNREVSDVVKNKIGTYTETDLDAFRLFLDYSNRTGVTWDAALTNVGMMGTVSTGGAVVRVSAVEDIKEYMRETSLRTLGRMPTKNEMQQAIKNIQNAERAAVRAGQQMPSLRATAQAQVTRNAPESGAYAAGTAIARMFQLLGGGR